VNLSAADREVLAQIEEVRIETQSSTGDVHRTIIWVVVDGEEAYIRSVKGEGARWYREALARPDVSILADGRAVAVTAVPAVDEASIASCTEALTAKYARDPALRLMLRPNTLPTTLRLDRRA
jgi:hypothetical protein